MWSQIAAVFFFGLVCVALPGSIGFVLGCVWASRPKEPAPEREPAKFDVVEYGYTRTEVQACGPSGVVAAYVWHRTDLSDLAEPYLSAVKAARAKHLN